MTRAILVAACLLGAEAAMAADPVPNQFTPGTAAEAAKVNANFADVIAKLTALETRIAVGAVPVGTVQAFAGDASAPIPNGFLLCNGQAVSRTTYAALFAVLGIAHGGGNGTTTFNLPDYRGRFLRARDAGAGRDPDRSSRTAPQPAAASAGATGDAVGSVQTDAFGAHAHGVSDPGHFHSIQMDASNPHGWNTGGFVSSDRNSGRQVTDTKTTGISVNSAGGSETRPENAYVNYIVKY
jgi:microcystin-dependent protein